MVSSLEIERLRFRSPVIKAQIVELNDNGASFFVKSSLICQPVEIERLFLHNVCLLKMFLPFE